MRDLVTPEVDRLREAGLSGGIIVGDLILLELLQGCRDEVHAAQVRSALRCCTLVAMLDPARAARAAANFRRLRSEGVTPRRTVDLIIATFCIDNGLRLLHKDRDFAPMIEHLGLQTA